MLVCPVCSAVLVSNGKRWYCPVSSFRTQFNPHPSVGFTDRRTTVNPTGNEEV